MGSSIGTALFEERHHLRTEIVHRNHPGECTSCNPGSPSGQPRLVEVAVPTFFQRTDAAILIIEAVFLCGAIGLLCLGTVQGFRELVGDLAISFLAIMVEAMPFMLLGSIVGGLIETFVPEDLVSRFVKGRTTAAVFIAAGLGLIFPVCECAIVPVVRRLLRKGVPLSAGLAFLLGGPIVNPIVAGSTWLAYRFDWSFLGTRMICGYTIAVVVALIVTFLFRDKGVLLVESPSESVLACGCSGHDHPAPVAADRVSKFFFALQHASDDFFDVGRFLVIGAFLAALARTTIGVDALRDFFAFPGMAIILMMGLAIALNLCSETDAFIAAGFRGVLPDTAQMAFMVLGPMLDIKLILMYLTMFRKRVILTLSLLTFAAVLAAMMLLQCGFGGLPGAQ